MRVDVTATLGVLCDSLDECLGPLLRCTLSGVVLEVAEELGHFACCGISLV